MGTGPQDDKVDPAWTVLALRALLDGPTESNEQVTLHLTVGGHRLTITNDRGLRRVQTGHRGVASARLEAPMPALVAVSSGMRPISDLTNMVDGERAVVQAVLSPALRPSPLNDEADATDPD